MKRVLIRGTEALLLLALLPVSAFAQASITGVVRDSSGAVLPGVTVEAASPEIIEKVRTATTDGTGTYRITELRPGAYTVTFTLTGFNTVKREGINLTGAFTATVDAEMRVGALEETITVTGETPIVDVQSSTRQRVMDADAISTLPTGRNMFELGVLIPGVSMVSQGGTLANHNVGGAVGPDGRLYVTAPGLASQDAVHALDREGVKDTFFRGFGRPQGLAFSKAGDLYCAACYQGRHGIVKISADGSSATHFVAGPNVVGLCFTRNGEMIVATGESVYSIECGIEGTLL